MISYMPLIILVFIVHSKVSGLLLRFCLDHEFEVEQLLTKPRARTILYYEPRHSRSIDNIGNNYNNIYHMHNIFCFPEIRCSRQNRQ